MHPLLRAREWIYREGLRKSVALPAFTVSVGNLSVGGTGKSPLTDFLCALADEKEKTVTLLSRGYGRKAMSPEIVEAHATLPHASVIGDEPWMIKARHPKIRLVVHPDRALIAQANWPKCEADIMLLDDAFQHWRAVRDLDIVLLDAHESLHQATLPLGRLREPKEALRRADILVISRSEEVAAEKSEALRDELLSLAKLSRKRSVWRRDLVPQNSPLIVTMNYRPSAVYAVNGKDALPCESLRGRDCILLSGIARENSFRRSAESCGAKIVAERKLPDHRELSSSELENLDGLRKQYPHAWILITEKDWARWQRELPRFPNHSYRLCVELKFSGDGKDQLTQKFWEAYECTKF